MLLVVWSDWQRTSVNTSSRFLNLGWWYPYRARPVQSLAESGSITKLSVDEGFWYNIFSTNYLEGTTVGTRMGDIIGSICRLNKCDASPQGAHSVMGNRYVTT